MTLQVFIAILSLMAIGSYLVWLFIKGAKGKPSVEDTEAYMKAMNESVKESGKLFNDFAQSIWKADDNPVIAPRFTKIEVDVEVGPDRKPVKMNWTDNKINWGGDDDSGK